MAQRKFSAKTQKRTNRTIHIDFETEEKYKKLMEKGGQFIGFIIGFLITIGAGLRHKKWCKGGLEVTRHSHYKRLCGVTIWRLQCKECLAVFTILPHFIIRYSKIRTEEAEKSLTALLGGLSFDNTAAILSIASMPLYRLCLRFGRIELVGLLLAASVRPPSYGAADEKHTWLLGKRHYAAIWASGPIVWGIDLAEECCEEALEKAYAGTVKQIESAIDVGIVKGVVTDGFTATKQAASKGSSSLKMGHCLGHFSKKFKHWAKRVSEDLYIEFRKRLKTALNSDKESMLKVFRFAHRMSALIKWAEVNLGLEFAVELQHRYLRHKQELNNSMADADMPRNSVWADWFCNVLDRKLFMMKYFHGNKDSAVLFIKALAVLYNFKPYGQRAKNSRLSPIEVAGGHLPSNSWLASIFILSAGGLLFNLKS